MISTQHHAAPIIIALTVASAASIGLASPPPTNPAPGSRGAQPDGQGPTSVNILPTRDLLGSAETRRIDVVCLGDSNQLFSGFGWQDGWTVGLGELYPMFATPLLGAGDNNAIGLALNTMASAALPPVGAPIEILEFNDPTGGVDATPYGFLPGGMTIPAGTELGMRLVVGNTQWPKINFNADNNLRFHFNYGTFDSAPGAVFQPQVVQPGSASALHPPINPGTGSFGIASSFIDLGAGARNTNDIRFRWFSASAPDAVGPVHTLYMRAEDLDQTTGQSVSTLFGVGGATARDCAVALQSTSESQLRVYFEQIRDLQPGPKQILIRIAFGANDITEQIDSVGPDGPFPAATNESVADNIREIILQINEVWTLAGWNPDELVFLLVGPHDRLEPEPDGYGFRQTIADVALDAPNISFVNHYRLATRAEMLTSSWYAFPTGAHLTQLGYENICQRELGVLLTTIAADLNGDCVVDTADLGAMLMGFGTTSPVGDLNSDGVIDTADLGQLLTSFGAMCDIP